MKSQYDLDTVLCRFNGREPFTIRNACEGVSIWGGIGSGKTSGSGATLAKAFLRAQFGGLVLCAKKDECDTWLRYAEETGRSESVIVFDASGKWRFPFLQYEVGREGEGAGYTENLVRLFTTVQQTIERGSGGGSDPYWSRAMQQLIRNAIDLAMIVRGAVSIPLLYDIVMSAPSSIEERNSEEWQNGTDDTEGSLCWKLLMEGNSKELGSEWELQDLGSTAAYWLKEFPSISPKTRSGIISMFTSMADSFLRRPFRMLFSEPAPQEQIVLPEFTHQGLIVIMNLPVKEFGEAGRAAQVVYKYMWQQAAERRDITANDRPIFLWADEAQNFITEYDMQFQATTRSTRSCTIYLTQNLPNYYAEMGGAHSKYRVDSLVGNFQTKIWHSNSDPETNTNASEIIGKDWQTHKSTSTNAGMDNNASAGTSSQESFDYQVIPKRFTELSKGSPINNYVVEAIIFQSGRKWSNGKTYLDAIFDQRIN